MLKAKDSDVKIKEKRKVSKLGLMLKEIYLKKIKLKKENYLFENVIRNSLK